MSTVTSTPAYEADDLRWFTVTGAPRSGTTMLGRLLNTHPAIGCLNEIELPSFLAQIDPFFERHRLKIRRDLQFRPARRAVRASFGLDEVGRGDAEALTPLARATRFQVERKRALRQDGFAPAGGALDPARHAADVARALVEIGLGKRGLTCIGTKVPNLDPVEAARQVAETLPNMRLIHVVRRPSDVVNSSLGLRGLTRLAVDDWHIRTVEEACAEWRTNWNRIAVAQGRLGDRLIVVKYEDLLNGRADVAEAITGHLGLSGGLDLSMCRALPMDLEHYALEPDERLTVDRILGAIDHAWSEPLDALLARFPTAAFPLPADGVIDFTIGGNGHLFASSGFSSPESGGTWTDDAVARLDMRLGERPGDLRLTFDTTAWRRDYALPFEATLRVGAWHETVWIEAGVPGQAFQRQCLIPRSALPDPSLLRLEFCILEPKRAGDQPLGDGRGLGLCLRRLDLVFEPVSTGR